MRKEYNLPNGRKNPYVDILKSQRPINVSSNVIDYFKKQAESCGIPYQTLINLYLEECVRDKKTLHTQWK